MPSSTPHQKFCFYHLPTRGRAGIKLGDAWYVSNVSIIFDCPMLYYLMFWTLLGFIIHFYIIFGTSLLTGGPAQNGCFLPISEFRRKRISNRMKPSGTWFLERTWSRRLGPYVREASRKQRGRGRAYTPGTPSTLVGPMLLHRRTSSSYIYLRTLKTSRSTTKHNFHRRNLMYPRDPILEPSSALCRRGDRPWRASTSTP